MCYQQLETPFLLGRFSPDQQGDGEVNRFFQCRVYCYIPRMGHEGATGHLPSSLPGQEAQKLQETQHELLLTLGTWSPSGRLGKRALSTCGRTAEQGLGQRGAVTQHWQEAWALEQSPRGRRPIPFYLAKDAVCVPAGKAHGFERRIKHGYSGHFSYQ